MRRLGWVVFSLPFAALLAAPHPRTGKEVYEAGCIACHGPDGKGAPRSAVAFQPPRTFPDFTDCKAVTPEFDSSWRAVLLEGGPARGFSVIMPSFRDELTAAQIDAVIQYLRTLCRDRAWPRGELNVPLALVTEKAFPENEEVIRTSVNARGAPGVSVKYKHEHRFGARNQIELSAPLEFQHPERAWHGGFGDVSLALKRVLVANLDTGSIFSLIGEVALPTGNRAKGLGSGVTTFGTAAAFGQLLPHNAFFQFQGGADLPTDTSVAPTALFWRTVFGKSFNQGRGLGRMWSPMVELVAERDLETGARTNWDVVPQMQVTLNKRQNIRANAGVRIPFTNTAERPVQVMFYLLWDWQDGRLNEGW
jgi:mono/diheme cytochrome c family protein